MCPSSRLLFPEWYIPLAFPPFSLLPRIRDSLTGAEARALRPCHVAVCIFMLLITLNKILAQKENPRVPLYPQTDDRLIWKLLCVDRHAWTHKIRMFILFSCTRHLNHSDLTSPALWELTVSETVSEM